MNSKSLIWFSITVAIHLSRPVAVTYLGIKKKSGVAVVDPELNYFLYKFVFTVFIQFTRPPLQTKYLAQPDSWSA